MMPPAPPAVAEGSGSRSSRAAALSEMQHTKKPAPASLKRVEQLLLEGERLPFELTKVLILMLLLLLLLISPQHSPTMINMKIRHTMVAIIKQALVLP
jgi:hypothetical protein